MVRRRSTGATSCSPTDCPARGSPRLGRPPASLRGRFHRNLHPASTRQNSATTRQTDKTGNGNFQIYTMVGHHQSDKPLSPNGFPKGGAGSHLPPWAGCIHYRTKSLSVSVVLRCHIVAHFLTHLL